MPNIQAQDLTYQPTVNPYSYSPPKPPLIKRVLSLISFILKPCVFLINILKKLFIKLLKIFIILIPEILILGVLFTVFLFILNYFNIISLSSLYPQYFQSLPHKVDIAFNSSILSKGVYSKDTNDWTIEAEFYKVDNESVYIKYNKQIAVLKKDGKISCSKTISEIISENVTEQSTQVAFCSDIINNSNKGKNALVIYKKEAQENFVIESINLE